MYVCMAWRRLSTIGVRDPSVGGELNDHTHYTPPFVVLHPLSEPGFFTGAMRRHYSALCLFKYVCVCVCVALDDTVGDK